MIKIIFAILFFTINAANASSFVLPYPNIRAEAFILIDSNGMVLAAKNENEQLQPSSLTKIMTAYVVASALEKKIITLKQSTKISEKAWKTPGTRTFVEVGDEVKIEDLVRGMAIQSGNDATIALVEAIANDEDKFVRIMNSTSEKFGLTNSNFKNSTGLPVAGQYSSAKDIATTASKLMNDFPAFFKYFSEPEFTYNKIKQRNRNLLLFRDPQVDGIHTGSSVDGAGYNIATSMTKNNLRLIAVILGASGEKERASESYRLLNYGYRYFVAKSIYKPNEIIYKSKIWLGKESDLDIGSFTGIKVTVPKQETKVRAKIDINKTIKAPIFIGDIVGTIKIYDKNENLILTEPLVALENVESGGVFTIIIHQLLLFLGLE